MMTDPTDRFELLIRPELDALFRTARRLVGQSSLAEEIVQEACLRAFGSFEPAMNAISFRPWIFRIMINVARDELRRQRRWNLVLTEGGFEHAVTTHEPSDPIPLNERAEHMRAIANAFAALGPELHAVAVLVLVEGLNYSEAADALSIAEGLVRSRLARARTKLRHHIAGSGISSLNPERSAKVIAFHGRKP